MNVSLAQFDQINEAANLAEKAGSMSTAAVTWLFLLLVLALAVYQERERRAREKERKSDFDAVLKQLDVERKEMTAERKAMAEDLIVLNSECTSAIGGMTAAVERLKDFLEVRLNR